MSEIHISAQEFKRMQAEGKLDPRTNPRLLAAAAKLNQQPNDSASAEAFEDAIDIAGYRCRPLTLATLMLLQRAGSPLVTGTESSDPIGDAMIALWILAGDEAAVLKTIRDTNELWETAYQFAKDIDVAKARQISTALQGYLDKVATEMGGGEADEKKVQTPTGNST